MACPITPSLPDSCRERHRGEELTSSVIVAPSIRTPIPKERLDGPFTISSDQSKDSRAKNWAGFLAICEGRAAPSLYCFRRSVLYGFGPRTWTEADSFGLPPSSAVLFLWILVIPRKH